MAATRRAKKGDEDDGERRHQRQQEKLDRKTYERELARLHAELVKLQLWAVQARA